MKIACTTAIPLSVVIITLLAGCTGPRQQPARVETPQQSIAQPIAPAADGRAYLAACGGKIDDLGTIINPIVTKLVAQKIPYSRDPANEWRDCSGSFLRLSSYLASACPEHQSQLLAPPGVSDYAPGGNNVVPLSVGVRSSRDAAKWYHSQGRFTPIYYDEVTSVDEIPADLHRYRNLIRPGAVVWFSFSRPNSGAGVDALFVKKISRGSHINHMATITSVRRGEDGNVESFEMFHGRSTGKPASITRTHYWSWPEKYLKAGKQYPSFGYWNQYLVGIAPILPPVSSSASN